MNPVAWLRSRLALRRRRSAIKRLERASGVVRFANVRLQRTGDRLMLIVEDELNRDVRLVRLTPDTAYRLGRDLTKAAKRARP